MVTFVKTHKCAVQKYHWPPIIDTDLHHIIPLMYKGPNTVDNLREMCNNCHRSIHEYIDAVLKLQTVPKITRAQKKIAEQGLKGLWFGPA